MVFLKSEKVRHIFVRTFNKLFSKILLFYVKLPYLYYIRLKMQFKEYAFQLSLYATSKED